MISRAIKTMPNLRTCLCYYYSKNHSDNYSFKRNYVQKQYQIKNQPIYRGDKDKRLRDVEGNHQLRKRTYTKQDNIQNIRDNKRKIKEPTNSKDKQQKLKSRQTEIKNQQQQNIEEQQVVIYTEPLLNVLKFYQPTNNTLQILANQIENKQTITQQEHQEIMTKLSQAKFKSSQSLLTALKYFAQTKLQPEIEQKLLNKYITSLLNEQQTLINLDIVLHLHPQNILLNKKRITKLSMKHPSLVSQLFKHLVTYFYPNNDELRVFDNYFSENIHSFSLIDQIQILQMFAQTEKKGVFIQLFKQKIIQDLPSLELTNKHLFAILLSYHKLNEIQTIRQFQQKLIFNMLNNKFNPKQKAFVIQLFHQSGIGSSQFWTICKISSSSAQTNELFAILGGLFRNNQYDSQLFLKLLAQDNQIQLINTQLTEDEFLRVMLVYYGNYLVLIKEYQLLVSRLLLKRLKDIYKIIKYKNNVNMFMWLLIVEAQSSQSLNNKEGQSKINNSQVDLQFKLCHFKPYQKSLLSMKFNVGFQLDKQDEQYMNNQYKQISKLSIVQEIIIRRKQISQAK